MSSRYSIEVPVRILIERIPGLPITAHCLEMDLMVDGDSIEEVLEDIMSVIRAHLDYASEHGVSPFSPAPREYWDKLAKAGPLEIGIGRSGESDPFSGKWPPFLRLFEPELV